MFEESLLPGPFAHRKAALHYAVATAILVQSCVAAAVWVTALVHPPRLPLESLRPRLMLLPPRPHPRPPAPVERVHEDSARPASAQLLSLPRLAPPTVSAHMAEPPVAPEMTLASLWPSSEIGPPASVLGDGTRGAAVGAAAGAAAGSGKSVGHDRTLRVSSGVSSGMLLAPIRPAYPRMAVAARVEGTVVVEAVISREGAVLRAHVTSGPPMLAQAALDAVRAARYKPYSLNGTATEVETTFSIHFRLGGAG